MERVMHGKGINLSYQLKIENLDNFIKSQKRN